MAPNSTITVPTNAQVASYGTPGGGPNPGLLAHRILQREQGMSYPAGYEALDSLYSYSTRCRSSREAIGMFRAASPLPPLAQQVVDGAVSRVGRARLVLVNDLLNAGLTYSLPNWLGVMQLGTDQVNDVGFAQRSMELDVRGERQVQDRSRRFVPIFITSDDFSFGPRELAEAERVGTPLDVSHVEQATRNCNVAIEDQAWNGIGFNVDGNSAPGILTNPGNTYTYAGGLKWTDPAKTGEMILQDVQNMAQIAYSQGYPGPYNLYVPLDYGAVLNHFLVIGTTTFQITIRQALENLEFGNQSSGAPSKLNIRVADLLTNDYTALIQMTSNVIDVVVGQQPTQVSWAANNGLGRRFFVVIACVITRVKSDYNNAGGIVIGHNT